MVELTHVLVGTAIATQVGNPILALPLSLASHFALDLVPHWNPSIYSQIKKNGQLKGDTKRIMSVDSALALVSGLIIAYKMSNSFQDINQAIIILLSAFFAVLPDVLEIPYYFWKVRTPLMVRFVEFSHSLQSKASIIPGTITQIVVSIVALWWLFG